MTDTLQVEPTFGYGRTAIKPISNGALVRTWQDAIEELLAIRSLEDDWDGQGTPAPSAGIVDGAIRLAQTLNGIGHHPAGRVTPGPSGTISFEWYEAGDYAEIEVIEPNRAEGRFVAKGATETRSFAVPGFPAFAPPA